VAIQTPKKLSKVQKELLRQLGDSLAVENTPTSRSLFEKVKEIFS
jgi:molecular chaperone DnaJ